NQAGHPEGAFPIGILLGTERRRRGIGPGILMRAVVRRVDDDRIVGDAEIVDLLEQSANNGIVLDHAVVIFGPRGQAGLVSVRGGGRGLSGCWGGTWVRKCMRGALNQQKNGLFALPCRSMKSMAAADVSSSIVSMRFFVSGPVSSILPSDDDLMTPRGPNFL